MSTELKGRPLTFPLTTDTPCREWQGCTDQDGYGSRGHLERFKTQRVHSQIIEMIGTDQYGNPLEAGEIVMHKCDNPSCYRYDHLVVGTKAENAADSVAKGRHTEAAKTHCKRDHPFDEANTRHYRGKRICLVCERERKARRAKKKADQS